MLALSEAEVRELLPAADLVDVMEQALAAFSSGQVNQPVRTAVAVGLDRAFFGVMPASVSMPAGCSGRRSADDVVIFKQGRALRFRRFYAS